MSAVPLRGLLHAGGLRRLWRDPRYVSLAVTVSLFLAMSVAGGVLYDGFLRPQVFLNLFIDNGFVLIVAVGMTFVILTGGIDLSVGAVVAFSTVLLASLVQHHGWHPLPAMAAVLALGTAFGTGMGAIIQRYRLQPFVVTLAGMFLARGAATLVSVESIGIDHAFHVAVASVRIPVGGGASLYMRSAATSSPHD
jgi:galactofuranose transport system permease protein